MSIPHHTPQLIATMGITTCASTSKENPTSRATIVTAATPKERRSKQLAKSPRTVNVNPLIAKINLPGARFDNVLEALRPTTTHASTQDDNLNNSCDRAPPSEKTKRITPLASPTGVNQQPIEVSGTTKNDGSEGSLQARVRISKATVTVEAEPTPAAPTTSRRSILQSKPTGVSQGSNSSISDDDASQSKNHIKKVHDRTNMLFWVFNDNRMKEICYHVSGFAGLYPV
jgi:hypothetical protein